MTVRGGTSEKGGLMVRLKIGFYFALWYLLNIVYNSKCRNDLQQNLLTNRTPLRYYLANNLLMFSSQ